MCTSKKFHWLWTDISILVTVIAILFLTGCCIPKQVIVYKTIPITPDDSLIVDCLVDEPPDKIIYQNATEKEREKLLYTLATKQMKNIFVCNKRFNGLREWKQKQNEMHSSNASK